MGFVPAGSFAIVGIATLAGTRWALIGPAAVIVSCGVVLLLQNVASEGRQDRAGPAPAPAQPAEPVG
jgi:cell division protein FtsW (lipid II flippase)